MESFLVTVWTSHIFFTNTPPTASHLAQVVVVLFGAFAAAVYFEQKSHAAFCQIKNLREDLDAAQAKHSSVVDDLNKTTEKKLSNAEMVIQFTKKDLEDATSALEQTRRIASAHFEFREALTKELTRMRAQRDWAAGGINRVTDALAEARRKSSSQELVAYEMQSQIKYKANELRDMTLSLENIKKELALANKFSQEAQDEIDAQHVKIEEQETFIEKKEKTILSLLERVRHHKMVCKGTYSTIGLPNLRVDSVITNLEKMNGDLANEVKYWRGMSRHWSINNANTIRAMGSEIKEVRGELAEVNAENERLTRDLMDMVEQVESFDKERKAMTQQIGELEWNAIVPEAAKKEGKSFTEDVDMNSTEDEDEEDDDDDYEEPSWYPGGDSENDGTPYHEDNEEEEPEWFIRAPTATKCSDRWCTENTTLIKDESRNEEPDQWIEDVDALVNNEEEYEGNNVYSSLYSEDETMAISRIEEEDDYDLVSVLNWESDVETTGPPNW